jgi:Xaa-Pro aminopeptidase
MFCLCIYFSWQYMYNYFMTQYGMTMIGKLHLFLLDNEDINLGMNHESLRRQCTMDIRERVEKLRQLMKEKGMDAYIIPSSDAHKSEYVAEHWKCRQWISGFSGSAGSVVVTMTDAGLWTDGRYHIQAEKQLEGSNIKLFKMGQPEVTSYIEWLKNSLKHKDCVGFDGKVFSAAEVKSMIDIFKAKEIKLEMNFDLINELWEDRPSIPKNPIFLHNVKFAGKSRREKIEEVRKEMKQKGANNYLLASLDDIAWLLNIRGQDVCNNPVVTSYAIVSEDKVELFIDTKKVCLEDKTELEADNIEVKDYREAANSIKRLTQKDTIMLDSNKVNMWLYSLINEEVRKVEESDITTKLKAVKNDVEIENLIRCQTKDGVAMVKFIKWLKESVNKEKITEITVDKKLIEFRDEQEHSKGPSFDTIAGYKEHAAMMHYKAVPESDYVLKGEGMLLVDCGGQYLDGTTDITRTIVLGKLSSEEKRDFTLVLKAHIGLSSVKFLYGATGSNLDVLARRPLWEYGLDYKCGTGHGVGFLLNVHEGPQGFSQVPNKVKLEQGMVITNEPGIYKEGKHGVRTENTMLVTLDEKTEFGQFMRFKTISYCPIDLEGIDINMLTSEEKNWLNTYHKEVYDKLYPYLNQEEEEWLKKETRSV